MFVIEKVLSVALVFYVGVNLIIGAYVDERGFYHRTAEEESFRYARVHVYRNLMFVSQERLMLCQSLIQHILIDWEILRDEGILVKGFDELVQNMDARIAVEMASVEKIMQVDPRTAKILYPVNQSSVDEISRHFQGMIRRLEEKKPAEYARDRFEEMISQLSTANDELISTFRNVTDTVTEIKQKYNV